MAQVATKEDARTVLVFNKLKRLVGMFHSIASAAEGLGVTNSTVYGACTGDAIACKNHYLRFVPRDMEIEFSDFGKMKVEEFDKACGYERAYYATKNMTRKGMKYNMIPNKRNKKKKKNEDKASVQKREDAQESRL